MTLTFNVTGVWEFILTRLTERSTWTGIIGLLTAAGMTIAPQVAEQLAAIGIACASMLLITTQDTKPTLPPETDKTG